MTSTSWGAAATSRWLRPAAALVSLALVVSGCIVSSESDHPTDPTPVLSPADGEMFALVTVGTDEGDAITFGIDPAQMLSGEEARQKAVEDGVIAEGEDLPNDFYIANDEKTLELVQLADDARISVISANDTSKYLAIDLEQLKQLWDGEYAGDPVYGIVPATPIAMDVTVKGGVVSEAQEVYLP